MGLRSILAIVLKGKVLAVVLVSTALVGGATVAMASTPAQQLLTHQMAAVEKTATPTDHKGKGDQRTATPDATPHGTVTPGTTAHGKGQKNDQQCAGLAEAQKLATKFSLSTQNQSDDVEAICSLHDGSFKGTTTSGTTVSTSTIYGYGEIDQLLTYAQFLASHDDGNMSGKLISSNARMYVANALYSCGNTPLEVCLKTKTSDTHSGNNGNSDNTGNNGNSNSSGNGKGKGKPTSTPGPKH